MADEDTARLRTAADLLDEFDALGTDEFTCTTIGIYLEVADDLYRDLAVDAAMDAIDRQVTHALAYWGLGIAAGGVYRVSD